MKNKLIANKRLKPMHAGTFAACYLDHKNMLVYSFVSSKDTSRALYQTLPYNPHYPDYTHMGTYGGEILYISPYYLPLSGQALVYAEILNTCFDKVLGQTKLYLGHNKKLLLDFISILDHKLPESVINAFIGLSSVITDDYKLDIKLSNLRMDESGNLILLDVFYNMEALYN